MTPCVNAFLNITRVLGIAGVAFVVLGFWQRHRLEKFLRARWSKACPNPRKRFWLWLAGGAVLFSLQPFFVERCTGLHLSILVHLVTQLSVFAMFVGSMWLIAFVMPRFHARNPEGSL